ncbi:hypothetical protein lerEdw1_008605 [Lerista edwardsae]|nr:hypothetical protein lerEdw1_008605 [Lerista edwardsae]
MAACRRGRDLRALPGGSQREAAMRAAQLPGPCLPLSFCRRVSALLPARPLAMLDGLKMEETLQSALEPPPASFSSLLGGAARPRSTCEGCRGVIAERFLLRLNDSLWHERCVRCAACQEPLESTCFYRDKKLYCRLDYEK